MANRSRRHRSRNLSPLSAQSDTNIGSITGKNCNHSQCGRARILMEQLVRRDGPDLGLDRKARRRIIARVPHMLCTPGCINLGREEYIVLLNAFILACEEVQVRDGWLGHTVNNYETLRTVVLAQTGFEPPQPNDPQ